MKAVVPLAILVCIVLANAAAALEGTVVASSDDQPVAGAAIDVEASGVIHRAAAETGDDGGFTIDLRRLFEADALDTTAIALTVSADGFQSLTRVIVLPGRGKVENLAPIQIRLSADAASGILEPDEQARLRPHVTRSGHSLYVLPFASGDPDDFDLDGFAWALRRTIVSHIQALPVDDPPQDVAIKPIDANIARIAPTDSERILTVGRFLRALGMVTGEVHRPPDPDGDLELYSQIQIVPQVEGYGPGALFVDDRLPAGTVSPGTISRQISPLWKRVAVLAIAVAEYQDATQRDDHAQLVRIRRYLSQQRAEAGPDMPLLVRQMDRLIERIDRDLLGS